MKKQRTTQQRKIIEEICFSSTHPLSIDDIETRGKKRAALASSRSLFGSKGFFSFCVLKNPFFHFSLVAGFHLRNVLRPPYRDLIPGVSCWVLFPPAALLRPAERSRSQPRNFKSRETKNCDSENLPTKKCDLQKLPAKNLRAQEVR